MTTIPTATEHHCLRCHEGRVVTNVHRERLANGRMVERGTCSACGTKTSKFVKVSSA